MEEGQVEENPEPQGSEKSFYLVIGLIIIAIVGIILIPRLFEKESTPQTIEEIIEETLTEGETEDRRIYNGFVFVKDQNIWYSQAQVDSDLYKFGVRFNPYQVENITIEGNLDRSFINTEKVYITFDPHDPELTYISLGAAELTLNLARAGQLEVIPACMSEHPDCENREILSCNSTDKHVIEITNSNETKLIMDGNCIKIQGNEFEILRPIDMIIFKAYGIMG